MTEIVRQTRQSNQAENTAGYSFTKGNVASSAPKTIQMALFDYEGVVGPNDSDTKSLNLIRRNIYALLREQRGLSSDEEAVELRLNLLRKYKTDSSPLAMHMECKLPIPHLTRRIYTPHVMGQLLQEITFDPDLVNQFRGLAMPISILSNTSEIFVNKGLKAQGFNSGDFEHIVALETLDGLAKPDANAFLKTMQITGYDARTTALFDDKPVNLVEPSKMGMVTVHVGDQGAIDGYKAFVDYSFPNVTEALQSLKRGTIH